MITMALALMLMSPISEEKGGPTLYQKAKADWRSEVIPFPLGFAPGIDLVGREELRFAPGMYDADADDYFSYTFVWWVDGKADLSQAKLQKYLLLYYQGLYNAVSKKKEKDTSSFKASVNATREPSWTPHASQVLRAQVEWRDPFVTEKPLTLQFKIATWYCAEKNRTAAFFLVSPKSMDSAVWATMQAQEAGACDASN